MEEFWLQLENSISQTTIRITDKVLQKQYYHVILLTV